MSKARDRRKAEARKAKQVERRALVAVEPGDRPLSEMELFWVACRHCGSERRFAPRGMARRRMLEADIEPVQAQTSCGDTLWVSPDGLRPIVCVKCGVLSLVSEPEYWDGDDDDEGPGPVFR
jgi:DNA-directed RNA polymerase subunit RPC12/RpoP